MSATYINPELPGMIRNLYRGDFRPKSIQNMLDLAADLVQELIDLRAAEPSVTDEMVERAAEVFVSKHDQMGESFHDSMRFAIEAALSTERGK